MENNNQNDSWVLMGLLKLFLVGWAAVMFSKTAEVLTALAPLTLLGQTGLSVLYGVGTAVLIEGVAVILALLPSTHSNKNATIYAFVLFMISTFCQFLDASLVKDAANQSQTEAFFAFIALGIPSVGFGGLLLLLWTLTGTGTQKVVKTNRKPFRGVRTVWREFLDGSSNGNAPVLPETQVYAEDVEQEKVNGSKGNERKVRHE